jgi:hypothetical protein
MRGEKLSQIRLRWQQQHGEIAAIYHVASERASLFDKPAKVGIQLRGSTRDVDGWNIGISQSSDAEFGRLPRHALYPIRPCIDVTMPARLVAQFPNVDLKDRNTGCVKGEETRAIQLFV